MGAGGIIQQRARALLLALSDPSLFNTLPQHCKDAVNAIDAKPELDRTEADVNALGGLIVVATHH